ncbi:MAG: PPC domain-containing DNA-binding protein [Desulfobulbales bacterium]
MEYQAGSVGRVFYARLDDGDDVHQCIQEMVIKEKIRCAWFQVFGGLKSAGVVIGPKEPVMPPDPVWKNIEETREILGFGSIIWDDGNPLLHLHAAMGHHGETLTGCVRKDSSVYLVIELMVIEVTGIEVTRPWSESRGFNRPTFGSQKRTGKTA